MTGEQIIAQKDRTQLREPRAVFGEPALDGIALAVLFLGAVLVATNSGIKGTTLEWPGATTVADSRQ